MIRRSWFVALFALLAVATAAWADQEAEIKELAGKAEAMFKEKGRDYTLKVINATNSPFKKGSIYVFIADFQGVVHAHPVNRDFVGRSQWEIKDSKGKLFGQEFIKVAQEQGSGWVDYWWLRTGDKEPTYKKTWIQRIPGEDMFIACGYYEK